jgi:hypothetical protein
VPWNSNSNFDKATEEFNGLESYKCNKYHPKNGKRLHALCCLLLISLAARLRRSLLHQWRRMEKTYHLVKNLGDYVDSKGRMDVLQFYQDHKKTFPNLWIIVQREAAWRIDEVRCEQFFGLSGYV